MVAVRTLLFGHRLRARSTSHSAIKCGMSGDGTMASFANCAGEVTASVRYVWKKSRHSAT